MELDKVLCCMFLLSFLVNLGIFVCSFDVRRASQPFPSINYAQANYQLGNLRLKVCLTATWQLAQTHVRRKDLHFSFLYTLL